MIKVKIKTYFREIEGQWIGKSVIKRFDNGEETYFSENKYPAPTKHDAMLMVIASLPSNILLIEQALRRIQ